MIVAFLLLLLLAPSAAFARGDLAYSTGASAVSTTAVRYTAIANGWQTTDIYQAPMVTSGRISLMEVSCPNSTITAGSVEFEWRLNATTLSGVKCSINAGSPKVCHDYTNFYDYNAGDHWSVRATPSGLTGTHGLQCRFTVHVTANGSSVTEHGGILAFGDWGAVAPSSGKQCGMRQAQGYACSGTSVDGAGPAMIMPIDGTWIGLAAAPGTTSVGIPNVAFPTPTPFLSVGVKNLTTGLTADILCVSVSGDIECSDTTCTQNCDFSAGDYVTFPHEMGTTSPGFRSWGIVAEYTGGGQIYGMRGDTSFGALADTRYWNQHVCFGCYASRFTFPFGKSGSVQGIFARTGNQPTTGQHLQVCVGATDAPPCYDTVTLYDRTVRPSYYYSRPDLRIPFAQGDMIDFAKTQNQAKGNYEIGQYIAIVEDVLPTYTPTPARTPTPTVAAGLAPFGFTPFLWIDPSDTSTLTYGGTSGLEITAIADKGSNGCNFVATTVNDAAETVTNYETNQQVMQFDNSGDIYTCTLAGALAQPYYVWWVHKNTVNGGTAYNMNMTGGSLLRFGETGALYPAQNNMAVSGGSNVSSLLGLDERGDDASWYVTEAYMNGTASYIKTWDSPTRFTNSGTLSPGTAGFEDTRLLTFGYADSSMGDFIATGATTGERDTVRSYLLDRYLAPAIAPDTGCLPSGVDHYWVADDFTQFGESFAVTSWVDRVNGHVLYQGTTSKKPLARLNSIGGHTSLAFTSAAASCMGSVTTDTLDLSTDQTTFVVANCTGSGNNGLIIEHGPNSTSTDGFSLSDNNPRARTRRTSENSCPMIAGPTSQSYVVDQRIDTSQSTVADMMEQRHDGVPDADGTCTGTVVSNSTASDELYVGQRNCTDATLKMDCKVAAIAIYKSVLSDANRTTAYECLRDTYDALSNTPTPTPTSTPTPTITDTPTSTPTSTNTPEELAEGDNFENTHTPTPTITDTPTSTPTPIYTPAELAEGDNFENTQTPTSTPTFTPPELAEGDNFENTQTPASTPTVTAIVPTPSPVPAANPCYGNGVWLSGCKVKKGEKLIGNDIYTASFSGPAHVTKILQLIPDGYAGNCESSYVDVVPNLYYENVITCDDTGPNIMTAVLFLDSSYVEGSMLWSLYYRNINVNPLGAMTLSLYCGCSAVGQSILETGTGPAMQMTETYALGSKDTMRFQIGPFNSQKCSGTCTQNSFLTTSIVVNSIDQYADVQFMPNSKLEILENPKGTDR